MKHHTTKTAYKWGPAFVLAAALVTSSLPAAANSATERAGELQDWVVRCNDPNPFQAQGHVENALEQDDATVRRVCLRLALESDNAEIRALGLRAAIAGASRLSFDTTLPAAYAAELKKAERDERLRKKISGWYITRIWNFVDNGFDVEIRDASAASRRSTWYSLIALKGPSDNYKGDAVVTGSRVRWNGEMYFNGREFTCRIEAKLVSGPALEGALACADIWHIPIRAELL